MGTYKMFVHDSLLSMETATLGFVKFCADLSFRSLLVATIGVLDLVARGYVIPGGASQRGGGRAPMFQCRTLSDPVRDQA